MPGYTAATGPLPPRRRHHLFRHPGGSAGLGYGGADEARRGMLSLKVVPVSLLPVRCKKNKLFRIINVHVLGLFLKVVFSNV